VEHLRRSSCFHLFYRIRFNLDMPKFVQNNRRSKRGSTAGSLGILADPKDDTNRQKAKVSSAVCQDFDQL
jgi:hypothetical protein